MYISWFVILLNTHLFQRLAVVFLREEVDISGSDDAHQFAAHFARLCDRNTREAMSNFGLKHIPHCVAWTHHHWVCDKTLFKPLENHERINRIKIHIISPYIVQRSPKHHTQYKLKRKQK